MSSSSYFADTRDGSGPVSTPLTAERPRAPLRRAAARSDAAERRGAGAARARRPARLQPSDAPAIDGTPGVGAAPRRRLDRGADRRAQPVGRRVGDVAGRHRHRDAGRPLDVRPGGLRRRAAGGTFTSGGTEATFAGLLAARQAAIPGRLDARRRSRSAGRRVRRARALRRRARDWRARPRDEPRGRRAVARLPHGRRRARARRSDRLRRDGRQVMAVVATAGTTATGSFDDLEAIGRLCEERGIWLHVDGAHGASALLSAAHRHRLAGHPPRALDRVGPAQDDADAAHRERRSRPRRGRPRGGVQPARAVPVPGEATATGAGTRACAASRARAASTRSRCGWRSSATAPSGLAALYDHLCANAARRCTPLIARASRLRGPPRAGVEHPVLPLRRRRRSRRHRLDAVNLLTRERYNRPAPAGSRRRCWVGGGC